MALLKKTRDARQDCTNLVAQSGPLPYRRLAADIALRRFGRTSARCTVCRTRFRDTAERDSAVRWNALHPTVFSMMRIRGWKPAPLLVDSAT